MHTFQFKISIILGLFLIFSHSLFAQDIDSKTTTPDKNQVATKIDVSDEQKEKVPSDELKVAENSNKVTKGKSSHKAGKSAKNKKSKKDYRAKKARLEANSFEENLRQSTENYLEEF